MPMRPNLKQIVTNADMSSDVVSEAVDITNVFGYAVEANYQGANPIGTMVLQASVSGGQNSFDDIADSSYTITGSGVYIWNVRDVEYRFIRFSYSTDSGAVGTLNVYINTKGF